MKNFFWNADTTNRRSWETLLIPSYNPGTSPNSHDSGKVTSISHTVSDSEKSLPCKGSRFASPPKKD